MIYIKSVQTFFCSRYNHEPYFFVKYTAQQLMNLKNRTFNPTLE